MLHPESLQILGQQGLISFTSPSNIGVKFGELPYILLEFINLCLY